jgi:hypothetical protein
MARRPGPLKFQKGRLLQPVFQQFEEGLTNPDLKTAEDLLAKLRLPSAAPVIAPPPPARLR